MLIHASKLLSCPVLSLHVGGRIAEVSELIIDPNNLQLIACKLVGVVSKESDTNILTMDSVREFSRLGMIVDSSDEFSEIDDVIQVKEILKLNFSLTDLKVETERKTKLGKVVDYTLDTDTWLVHQLIVHRPILKSLIDPELTISRREITEVTDYKIIVKDEKQSPKSPRPIQTTEPDFVPNFVNPFRKSDLAQEMDEPDK